MISEARKQADKTLDEAKSRLAAQGEDIRRKLEAGETDQQILDYFVAAYGDSVLLEPPRRGLGWAVWLGPLLALAAGGVIVWLILRVWVRPFQAGAGHHKDFSIELDAASQAIDGRPGPVDSRPDETSPSALAARARQELDAVRKGLAR